MKKNIKPETKLWGARFKKELTNKAKEFSYSFSFDKELFKQDIKLNITYAEMLAKQNYLTAAESKKLITALKKIASEGIENLNQNSEDIHTAVLEKLEKLTGDLAKKINLGRSRNDVVVTEFKMYLQEKTKTLQNEITSLQKSFYNLAEKNINNIMPGFTHFQIAQPISIAHYFLAYFFMLQREKEFLKNISENFYVLPLGSSALAGSSINIDRNFLAKKLKFKKISENSLDSVASRDFVLDFLFALSKIMNVLSRLAEEIIIFTNPLFNFFELDDSVTTGSSFLPQKKNPDMAELIRAKSALVFSNLNALFATLKATPLSYNRDFQQDKELTFNSLQITLVSLQITQQMINTLKINTEKTKNACELGFASAADLAEYLTEKGIPFRTAHSIVGELVKKYIAENKTFKDLSLADLKKVNNLFDENSLKLLTPENSLKNKKTSGSTAIKFVKKQLQVAKKQLNN